MLQSFDRVSRFVFGDESLAKGIELPFFNLSARSPHQVQIEMQIVQRDQSNAQNFLRLDEMTNVAARKCATCLTRTIFFYWSFVEGELRVL